MQIGDVFEFLWADSTEFEWEWKCLGYNRFIVLRHTDHFPHQCVCIPISNGRPEFAKPGIDSSQQGWVYADDSIPSESDRHRLPFSPIAIELRPGKLRVKEDSRANYADILEVDHDAQVMVVGDVARYFDRVRRNTNKASMRRQLVKALTEYRAKRDAGLLPGQNHAAEASTDETTGGEMQTEDAGGARLYNLANESRCSLVLVRDLPRHERERHEKGLRESTRSPKMDNSRSSKEPSGDHRRHHHHSHTSEAERRSSKPARDSRDRDASDAHKVRDHEPEDEAYKLSSAEQERRRESRQQLPRSSGRGPSQGHSSTAAQQALAATPNFRRQVQPIGGSTESPGLQSVNEVAMTGTR